MSVPALEAWFSLSMRRNRRSFVLANIALVATVVVMLLVWTSIAATQGGKMVGFLLFGVPAVLSTYLLTAQRLHDLNLTGWLALLWVPINMFEPPISTALNVASLILLGAVPGTTGPNRYGEDPLAVDWSSS